MERGYASKCDKRECYALRSARCPFDASRRRAHASSPQRGDYNVGRISQGRHLGRLRAPHLNILELGMFEISPLIKGTRELTLSQGSSAGEAAASNIPRNIDHRFLSYTYATLASSVAPDGTAFFSPTSDPKPARTFDPTLEPAGQGYVEGSYDVIIAFWVMHALCVAECHPCVACASS